MERRAMLARAADILAAWNRGDPEGIAASVVEDVMWRDVALGKPLQGREALVTAAHKYMNAFPDLRIHETSSTLAGSRLAQELTVVGTHQGELLGVRPTGRWTETYAAVITTFDDDAMVIEGALYWSPLAMFQQLGILAGLTPATAYAARARSPTAT
jgi:predicted ester cyclase